MSRLTTIAAETTARIALTPLIILDRLVGLWYDARTWWDTCRWCGQHGVTDMEAHVRDEHAGDDFGRMR